ncbi:hypothetical protein AVEN_45531-1 [Araneus ventricosus]|uniref:Uncharacterized protein n=1 Tax=Araneus ventricosus TaxID=182803 RepID=A0A4Y2F559_ARAVE|nr:hypothetical protein AVEN_45531-1 [Araneus ventricosus]
MLVSMQRIDNMAALFLVFWDYVGSSPFEFFKSSQGASIHLKQLHHNHRVLRITSLVIQEPCLWTSKTNQQVKVWSDSELSLHSIDTKSPIAQQTQEILLKSTNIKLGWIRTRVGYSGNEAADVLDKKATQEGIPTYIPAPRNHS